MKFSWKFPDDKWILVQRSVWCNLLIKILSMLKIPVETVTAEKYLGCMHSFSPSFKHCKTNFYLNFSFKLCPTKVFYFLFRKTIAVFFPQQKALYLPTLVPTCALQTVRLMCTRRTIESCAGGERTFWLWVCLANCSIFGRTQSVFHPVWSRGSYLVRLIDSRSDSCIYHL